MKLKTKYILFIAMLHLTCLALSFVIFEAHKFYFIISEVIIIASLLLSLNLYKQLIQPLSHLKEGINAIRDRDFNVKFRPTGKTEMDELIEVYNQMMDVLREERTKQQEQHFFLEKLIHTSPTGIVILDYDQQVKQVNPSAAALLGADLEYYVKEMTSLKPGESRTIRIESVRTYKFQCANFIDRGFPRVFITIEELTAELFEAEKGAYGKVIRMMAHEVNNTIGPVNSILEQTLSTKSIWDGDQRSALKNAIQVAVDRNHNLNVFMRNFADLVKLPPVKRLNIDLVQLIHSVTDFMQIKAELQDIHFEFKLPASGYFILADAQQLEQALINIIKNAIEAITEGGVIHISLDPISQVLKIKDTGAGVSAQVSDQLFSPFFSTKKDGQGIGLTLVREILVNHGYTFSLKTEKIGETVFEINVGYRKVKDA